MKPLRTTARRLPKGTAGRRGAVALEYILIAALVALALMGAFLYQGRTLMQLFKHVAWDPSAALEQVIQ